MPLGELFRHITKTDRCGLLHSGPVTVKQTTLPVVIGLLRLGA
jgi:hypothetical protein